jgi:hypothetical protein
MRILLATLVTLFLSGTSFAEEGEATADTQPDSTEGAASEQSTDVHSSPASQGNLGSSAAARLNDMVTIELGYGNVMGGVPGLQFDALYSIKPNLQVGLLFNSGSLDLKSLLGDEDDVEVKTATLSGSLIAADARWFLGNSFYLRGGLGQRTINAELDIQHKVVDYGIKGDVEATSMVILFGLGNQWHWDSGFSLGAEWVGFAQPVSSSSSSSLEETGSAGGSAATKDDVEDLRDEFENLAKQLGESGSARLLILNIGWAF